MLLTLRLFVLKPVSDTSLLDADESVKFISNALEVLATLEAFILHRCFAGLEKIKRESGWYGVISS